jgi:hypothetical protein
MYGAGLISALLGIGSGVLKIPATDMALGLPIKVSSATSNFMIGVTAAASAGAYFVRGDINTNVAGPIALGSVLGGIGWSPTGDASASESNLYASPLRLIVCSQARGLGSSAPSFKCSMLSIA